eukprot:4392828-Pyramimonas_sp.AAC.1
MVTFMVRLHMRAVEGCDFSAPSCPRWRWAMAAWRAHACGCEWRCMLGGAQRAPSVLFVVPTTTSALRVVVGS